MILPAITKTVAIDAPPEMVFDFVANPENWPKWAVATVFSISPSEDNWWNMETTEGAVKLKILSDAAQGTLDHECDFPESHWKIPARVVPNGTGSLFMITFFKPSSIEAESFASEIERKDKELLMLKHLLEQREELLVQNG